LKNNRIILKLSGEILQGNEPFGISDKIVTKVATEIIKVHNSDCEIGIVIGAGNFFRGAAEAAKHMNRVNADDIGMLGTVQNSIALSDKFAQLGADFEIFTSKNIAAIGKVFNHIEAKKALTEKKIVIFAGGTGNPFFTTDTTAVLRALEVDADLILKGTKVDGVYDKDPVKETEAKLFKQISYRKYMELDLEVMDMTAISLAKKNQIPIKVFNITDTENITKAVTDSDFGSTIYRNN